MLPVGTDDDIPWVLEGKDPPAFKEITAEPTPGEQSLSKNCN